MLPTFQHQRYTADPPLTPHRYLALGSHPTVDSREWQARMHCVAAALRGRGVRRIYLIHGTFVGLDASGILSEIGRWIPALQAWLATRLKQGIDRFVGDHGNFTSRYAQQLHEALNADSTTPIDVRLFHWSSENHHLGRADGAVRLLDELLRHAPNDSGRTLLIGHSHAGNVLALLTQLLSGDRTAIETFFSAAQSYYRVPIVGRYDLPVWRTLRDRLREEPQPLDPRQLDLVTLGTPVRYGWAAGCHGLLLHLISHRPTPGLPPHRAKFPPTFDELSRASGGDYVQQFGIAGTNTPPSWLAGRAAWADARLHRLLQQGVTDNLFTRLRIGHRVPDAGRTLLVDFGEQTTNLAEHLAGHAVYTLEANQLFVLEQITTSAENTP